LFCGLGNPKHFFWEDMMKRALYCILFIALMATLVGFTHTGARFAGTIPTFSIIGVVKDESVTIQTANFPANQTFDVRMGKNGTLGVKGILVTSTPSDKGGTFMATYSIPEELHGQVFIAIRLESKPGYFSYNWFENRTSGKPETPVPPADSNPVATSTATPITPTISIVSHVKDETVTIKTDHFPASQTFEVRMGKIGTQGIKGILVSTVDSGKGGTFTGTYDIPSELHGQAIIAIRLECKAGWYSYNWFNNTTTP